MLLYLVNENIWSLNSGIEYAQMMRTKALQAAGYGAKIVTRDYNRMLSHDVGTLGLAASDYINMYDYFQQTTAVERVEQHSRLLPQIPLDQYHVNFVDGEHSTITDPNGLVGVIKMMPGTVGLVGEVVYTDNLQQPLQTEIWDWRGFKSKQTMYHPDGQVAVENYLRLDGTVALEVVHMWINGVVQPTLWHLINYRGQDYNFTSENELFTFFLNELAGQELVTFVVDRLSIMPAVTGVTGALAKYAYFHEDHKYEGGPDLKAEAAAVMALTPSDLDGIIVATAAQAADVAPYTNLPVQVLPSASYAPVDNSAQNDDLEYLSYVGRLAPEKQIIKLIATFALVHQIAPPARLRLQGYFVSPAYEQEVRDYIRNNYLDTVVEIWPYNPDTTSLFDHTSMYLSMSSHEGLNLSVVAAMAHGIPAGVMASTYTVPEVVEDDYNGIVFAADATAEEMAQQIIELFLNPSRLVGMQQAARVKATGYAAPEFVAAWREMLRIR